MGREAQNKIVEKPAEPFNPDGAPVPDEDLTEEQWATLKEISRKLLEEDDYIIVSGPGW